MERKGIELAFTTARERNYKEQEAVRASCLLSKDHIYDGYTNTSAYQLVSDLHFELTRWHWCQICYTILGQSGLCDDSQSVDSIWWRYIAYTA